MGKKKKEGERKREKERERGRSAVDTAIRLSSSIYPSLLFLFLSSDIYYIYIQVIRVRAWAAQFDEGRFSFSRKRGAQKERKEEGEGRDAKLFVTRTVSTRPLQQLFITPRTRAGNESNSRWLFSFCRPVWRNLNVSPRIKRLSASFFSFVFFFSLYERVSAARLELMAMRYCGLVGLIRLNLYTACS